MRLFVFVLSLSAGLPAFANRQFDGVSREAQVQVGSSCLNLRSRASSRSRAQRCLRSDSTLQVIDYRPGGYSKVRVNGRTGYVYSRYISQPQSISSSGNTARNPITGGPSASLPPAGGALTAAQARVQWKDKSWTETALKAIRAHWANLQNGRDIENFCSGYRRSSRAEKENCWLLIVGALVRRESGFRPGTVYGEGAPLYYNSVGLLQLSHNRRARECVKEGARSEQDLKNPHLNLKCGIRILARLVANKGQIAGKHGAGAYWSVLRNRGEHRYAKSHEIHSEASRLFRTQVAGRFPDRAVAAVPQEEQTAMR